MQAFELFPRQKSTTPIVFTQRRTIRTRARNMRETYTRPRELMQPHLYSNNAYAQSGVHWNSPLEDHRTWHTSRLVDFVYWGRELGLATNLHRHQRTAFDFDDPVHPTRIPSYIPRHRIEENAPNPVLRSALSEDFDPTLKPYSITEHRFTLYRNQPNQPKHSFPFHFQRYPNRLKITDASDVGSHEAFQVGDVPNFLRGNFQPQRNHPHSSVRTGKTPGLDLPFYGELDHEHMEAFSSPLNKEQTVCANYGRFSASLYINVPSQDQTLDTRTALCLGNEIDRHTNAILSKLTLLKSAQSGWTNKFCSGYSIEYLGRTMRELARVRRSLPEYAPGDSAEKKKNPGWDLDALPLYYTPERQEEARFLHLADRHLRAHMKLLWKSFSANRPLLTLINGECHTSGIGLALLPKYAVLRDSTVFHADGPNHGLPPFGGYIHFLCRKETSAKVPGLAEFIILTCSPLYSGDALRLGWSDLFCTLPDVDYHVREWFNNSEHLHVDAVTWQLGFLIDNLFRIDPERHSLDMERAAITPRRAQWIAETFADQQNVEGILSTLTHVEQLDQGDPQNNRDQNLSHPFTTTVLNAVEELKSSRLALRTAPWEITELSEDIGLENLTPTDVFSSYFFEYDPRTGHSVSRLRRPEIKKWQDLREQEKAAFKRSRLHTIHRHVYVRMPRGVKTISFDYAFHFGEPPRDDQTLKDLLCKIRAMTHFSETEELRLGWFLPTNKMARLRNDDELILCLLNDPGYEDPALLLNYPPIYLVCHPMTISFSEWAYSVKHLLLSYCPFALKCGLRMIQVVRGDEVQSKPLSMSETLELERRVFLRVMQRSDFHTVGSYLAPLPTIVQTQAAEDPTARENMEPTVEPEKIFDIAPEGQILGGHLFFRRPKWSPKVLEDVSEASVSAMFAPLEFERDQRCEIDLQVETYTARSVLQSMEDVGIQLVPRLGTPDVPNLKTNIQLNKNFDFYTMARHPWKGYASSWRSDGYTEGSLKYLTENYEHAYKYLYGQGPRANYWQNSPAARALGTLDNCAIKAENETPPDVKNAQLLRENFWDVIRDAEHGLEKWARTLNSQSRRQKFDYRKETPTPQENLYDDRYYQWFITPGRHPNPSLSLK